eukprot:CAMPEP_0117495482 /NCGR_PEP_ID=MMETSP0784-20121206/20156_1 /TAXON_ID=39447 /ORGANISM="" /LENGTH=165 /DNA_ID=CAMNT_0005290407 /DNA_START=7 /DNA_END=500 /DNA_ORIENTATION=-
MARAPKRIRSLLLALPLAFVALRIALCCGGMVGFSTPVAQGASSATSTRRGVLAALVGGVSVSTPFTPEAQAKSPGPTSDFWTGRYSDSNHPGCKRELVADLPGLVIKMRDGEPGCLRGEKQQEYRLPVKYKPNSDTILVDFSSKGGPSDVEAKWDGDGILFPDG